MMNLEFITKQSYLRAYSWKNVVVKEVINTEVSIIWQACYYCRFRVCIEVLINGSSMECDNLYID